MPRRQYLESLEPGCREQQREGVGGSQGLYFFTWCAVLANNRLLARQNGSNYDAKIIRICFLHIFVLVQMYKWVQRALAELCCLGRKGLRQKEGDRTVIELRLLSHKTILWAQLIAFSRAMIKYAVGQLKYLFLLSKFLDSHTFHVFEQSVKRSRGTISKS